MFSQDEPIQVTLKSVYDIPRPDVSFAVATNMRKKTPHCFRLNVCGDKATMTVDNVPESRATSCFPQKLHGVFSLASNGTASESGAFRYLRLTANGETLLDLDFTKMQSVDELETYFTCYYFETIAKDAKGLTAPIGKFWSFNENGHLVCSIPSKGRVAFAVGGPYALLTVKHPPLDDFETEVGFEQSWRIYGIVFGCDKQRFPFYDMVDRTYPVSVQGGLAFANAHNGGCYVYGNVTNPYPESYIPRTAFSCPQVERLFLSTEETTLPLHTLTYHYNDHMTYDFGTHVIKAQEGAVLYLPPNKPCRLRGKDDHIIRIEFECDRTFAPQQFTLKQPDLVKSLFRELDNIWHSNLPNRNYRALSVFYRILSELSRPIFNIHNDIVRAILLFIHNHFSEPTLTIKAIADALNISESHLYQSFHDACGMTPKEYILSFRIQHACTLLKTGKYKVYEVAEKSGFSDTKYFMTVFKKKMGVSPKKYALSV